MRLSIENLIHPDKKNRKYVEALAKALIVKRPRKGKEALSKAQRALAEIKKLPTKMRKTHSLKGSREAFETIAHRVLDLPALRNDYYLHLLDCSSKGIIAIALGDDLYLYKPLTREITNFFGADSSISENYIASVSFSPSGEKIAVGFADGSVQVFPCWNHAMQRPQFFARTHHIRSEDERNIRHGVLLWKDEAVLVTGAKNGNIKIYDVSGEEHRTLFLLKGHTQEVCSLSLNANKTLLASGGNDNRVLIWSMNALIEAGETLPTQVIEAHKAGVRALSFHPKKNQLLLTGGGSADKTIKLWKVFLRKKTSLLFSCTTNSQVTNLVWDPSNPKRFLSSYGFSDNKLVLWTISKRAKKMAALPLASYTGHTDRILFLAVNPNGEVYSAGGDETLRFWKIFKKKQEFLRRSVTGENRKRWDQRLSIR